MTRPPHLCSCGQIVAHGTLCACQVKATRARNQRHDATRPNARARGYDRRWEAARKEWLAHHPNCSWPDCQRAATVVDHIKPHKGDPILFWDRSNWASLCQHHHNGAKQRQERQP